MQLHPIYGVHNGGKSISRNRSQFAVRAAADQLNCTAALLLKVVALLLTMSTHSGEPTRKNLSGVSFEVQVVNGLRFRPAATDLAKTVIKSTFLALTFRSTTYAGVPK